MSKKSFDPYALPASLSPSIKPRTECPYCHGGGTLEDFYWMPMDVGPLAGYGHFGCRTRIAENGMGAKETAPMLGCPHCGGVFLDLAAKHTECV